MADTPASPVEMNISENLEEIRGELTGIFHMQGQRNTEFRVVISQGLRQIGEDLEVLLRRAGELLRRNGELVKDSGEGQGAADRFEKLQGEIEGQLSQLKDLNASLGDDCENLRRERDEKAKFRKDTAEGNEQKAEEIHKLTTEIDRLEIDNEAVRKDVTTLQREKEVLFKQVQELQALRSDFLTSIARYKEIKGGLIG